MILSPTLNDLSREELLVLVHREVIRGHVSSPVDTAWARWRAASEKAERLSARWKDASTKATSAARAASDYGKAYGFKSARFRELESEATVLHGKQETEWRIYMRAEAENRRFHTAYQRAGKGLAA